MQTQGNTMAGYGDSLMPEKRDLGLLEGVINNLSVSESHAADLSNLAANIADRLLGATPREANESIAEPHGQLDALRGTSQRISQHLSQLQAQLKRLEEL